MVTRNSTLADSAGEIMTLHQYWLNLEHGQVLCALCTPQATQMDFICTLVTQDVRCVYVHAYRLDIFFQETAAFTC